MALEAFVFQLYKSQAEHLGDESMQKAPRTCYEDFYVALLFFQIKIVLQLCA